MVKRMKTKRTKKAHPAQKRCPGCFEWKPELIGNTIVYLHPESGYMETLRVCAICTLRMIDRFELERIMVNVKNYIRGNIQVKEK